jgi:hypothetical protein
MLGISCVAAQLAVSKEGLSSMNDDEDRQKIGSFLSFKTIQFTSN